MSPGAPLRPELSGGAQRVLDDDPCLPGIRTESLIRQASGAAAAPAPAVERGVGPPASAAAPIPSYPTALCRELRPIDA